MNFLNLAKAVLSKIVLGHILLIPEMGIFGIVSDDGKTFLVCLGGDIFTFIKKKIALLKDKQHKHF
ncbi:hypothetical protein [Bartonella phoceensis]|uniref:hypothetical protein n=1 Tax=Bartonella phoceensis TaxID=270249 RepID=UPI001ABBC655|nr:hypothetical protein [Bartonella phoceensis]